MKTTLYHITRRASLASINATGLDPAYATGARAVVWLADRRRVMWAIQHAANHQQCHPSALVVVAVRVNTAGLQRTAWRGVYVSPTVIHPRRIRGYRTGPRRKWSQLPREQ